MDHRPAEVEECEHPLLHPVGERGEAAELGEDRERVRHVLGAHAAPVGGAEHEPELGEVVELA
jgi:hypothetical protein